MIVDAHIDLAWSMVSSGRDYRRPVAETRRLEAGTAWPALAGEAVFGVPECRRGGVGLVFATLYATPDRLRKQAWDRLAYDSVDEAHRLYRDQLDLYHRLRDEQCEGFDLLATRGALEVHERRWEAGEAPVGFVVLMEGADAVREPVEVERWAERGVRIVAPAWGATRYAGSSSEPGPLTRDGLALLEEMGEQRMILDVSHLSERATEQAIDTYTGSIVASHSNPRALLPNAEEPERHLADRHITALAERGGVIGVHLFGKFVADGWERGRPRPPLGALLNHIDYICQAVGSARHVGIGSDIDGGFGLDSIPAGLDTIADLQLIGVGLAERGYAEDEVAAVLGENWLVLLRRSLP